jgi:pimeloyl-ACP methyl ester carboxylesterase
MLENAHPVQDLRNFLVEAEETTMSTASQVYENASTTATHMAANAYNTIIGTGTNMDKQLSAIGHATQQQLSEISHATQQQLAEAWKSVKAMQKRLEAAELLSGQLKRIKQQLKGYRALLNRMREMSSAVPSQQMAKLMRRITECYESIDRVESRAIKGLTTGFAARVNNLLGRKEPKRYAKYSSDPLLGVGTFPLGFHLIALAGIEIPLRIMMHNRGFLRSQVGPVAYYYHPGKSSPNEDVEKVPIVFIHGIGIGLMFYPALIDYLLSKGRPILLPEIPYVSGFKFYQSASSVLPPAVVCSTLTEMLARHGHLKGTFAGHSYGTSWLSYMTKYSPNTVAALCFIDPICFCLHYPRLTKQFVYHRPDPGTISYMVHTDLIVKHTIQRAFPWTHIILFAEQIHVPCSIFLSDGDAMVPAEKVEEYFRKKGAPIKDVSEATREYFFNGDLQVAVFRGDNHGEWTERTDDIPLIGECFEVLCSRVDEAAALEPQSVIQ